MRVAGAGAIAIAREGGKAFKMQPEGWKGVNKTRAANSMASLFGCCRWAWAIWLSDWLRAPET